jgi:hypothetical protein
MTESAIVWMLDESISSNLASATYDEIDPAGGEPFVSFDLFFDAFFPNATSLTLPTKKRQRRATAASDIWDNGNYITAPWQDVSVSAGQETCPEDQTIVMTAVDADGNTVASNTGVNYAAFVIPADTAYPVTVTASAQVGILTSVLSNALPIKIALGDGDNGTCI